MQIKILVLLKLPFLTKESEKDSKLFLKVRSLKRKSDDPFFPKISWGEIKMFAEGIKPDEKKILLKATRQDVFWLDATNPVLVF